MDRLQPLRISPRSLSVTDLAGASLEDVKHGLGSVEVVVELLIASSKSKGPHRVRVKWQHVDFDLADSLDLSIVSSLALKRNAILRSYCSENGVSFDDLTNSSFTKIRSSDHSSDTDVAAEPAPPRTRRGRRGATRFGPSHFSPPSSALLSAFAPAVVEHVAFPVAPPVVPDPPARLGTRGLGIAPGARAGTRR